MRKTHGIVPSRAGRSLRSLGSRFATLRGTSTVQSPARAGFVAFLVATLLTTLAGPALAVDPAEMLKDPKLEARAEKIGGGLRCMVCQSESIEESNADLARDLRVIVRQRLVAGDSDQQVVDYVHSRYGDYVLLDPPFKAKTLVLWLGPFALLLAAAAAGWAVLRRRAAAAPPPPLTPDEKRRLDALLKDAGQS